MFLNKYNFFKNIFLEKRLRDARENIVFFSWDNQVFSSKNTLETDMSIFCEQVIYFEKRLYSPLKL